MPTLSYFLPLFFLAALIYASVGFGGGSTYLALMALAGFSYQLMPSLSLVLNLVVVTGGSALYFMAGHLCLKRLLPFVLTSIPMAWWGGTWHLSQNAFLMLLGIALAAAGLRLLFIFPSSSAARLPMTWKTSLVGIVMGAVLGWFSGLIGIGGGIFLAPLLYFLKWGNARQIAAAASFFILVNSAAGLLGQWHKGPDLFSGLPPETVWQVGAMVLAVFAGGQIGSRLSVGKLSLIRLQRITALLILVVAVKIFWQMEWLR